MMRRHAWQDEELKDWKEAKQRAKLNVERVSPQLVLDEDWDPKSEERMEMISTIQRRKLKIKKHKRKKRKKKLRSVLREMKKI